MKEEKKLWLLPMGGAHNMRDLGGFVNAFGKHTKYKKIFRSDDLTSLTMEDLGYLDRLPIRTVIDFRSTSEIQNAVDHLPQTVSQYIKLSIEAGNINEIDISGIEKPEELMKQMYANIVRGSQELFKKFFKIIQDRHNLPLIFHCTAGKDRTGIASALFLSALMVDKKDIMIDYMRSRECLKGKYGELMEKYPELESLLTVKEEYLQEAFRIIDEEYEGMENYLVNYLDVEVAVLRELYTE